LICTIVHGPIVQVKNLIRSMKEPRAAEKFGKIIRKLRHDRQWTQDELAAEMQADASYISRIERGLKNPSLETVLKLAEVFEIKVRFGNQTL
jgi:transcriptional regulator with XRE-family HTH domain